MTAITTDWLPFANASQSSGGVAWDRLNSFNFQGGLDKEDENTYARAGSVPGGELTQRVRLWGITLPTSVPSNAVLVGIEMRLWNASSLSTFADDTRRLMIGTTEVGDNLALPSDYTSFLNNGSIRVSGGPANLWGTSITKSDIGANFGFRFRAVNTGSKDGSTHAARAAVRFTFDVPSVFIRVGTVTPDRLYLGTGQASAAYLGSDRVF